MVGEINLERSGCGENEQKACEKGWKSVKLAENPKMTSPQCGRSIKTSCQTTTMPEYHKIWVSSAARRPSNRTVEHTSIIRIAPKDNLLICGNAGDMMG